MLKTIEKRPRQRRDDKMAVFSNCSFHWETRVYRYVIWFRTTSPAVGGIPLESFTGVSRTSTRRFYSRIVRKLSINEERKNL